MITIKEFDYKHLKDIRVPVPDPIAQELLDFVVAEKLWPDNIHRLHQRVRDFKAKARAAQEQTPQPPTPIEAEGWIRKALAMREQTPPVSWRQIARAVEKPNTTVRREVARALVAAGSP